MEITVNRNDTALLKGIAIVAIVFHNFSTGFRGQ